MTEKKQHDETDYFDLISVDLVLKILSELPVKSLSKCRCVSKLWSSIIRSPNYNQLFPSKPPDTPKLLFAIEVAGDLLIYSSPQPQNPDKNSSLVATRHYTNLDTNFNWLCRPVCGLVYSRHVGNNESWAVISNPITGERVTTPKVRIYGNTHSKLTRVRAEYSFGYDPIDKQFKVLRITCLTSKSDNWFDKYHVLTLGTEDGNLLWKKIQCCTPHYPLEDNKGICINGVLYYLATIDSKNYKIVCFDVRFEKFSFIYVDQDLVKRMFSTYSLIDYKDKHYCLIDYKGKLGIISHCDIRFSDFELWVLEDVEKQQWSKHFYRVQHPWLKENVRFAGMIDSGKIVLYPSTTSNPFYIFYYNLEKKDITRVEVVFEEFKSCRRRVYIFPNFVEDVKLM